MAYSSFIFSFRHIVTKLNMTCKSKENRRAIKVQKICLSSSSIACACHLFYKSTSLCEKICQRGVTYKESKEKTPRLSLQKWRMLIGEGKLRIMSKSGLNYFKPKLITTIYENISQVITAHCVFILNTNPVNAAQDNNRCSLRDSLVTPK